MWYCQCGTTQADGFNCSDCGTPEPAYPYPDESKPFHPSRLEYFTAAALTGLMAGNEYGPRGPVLGRDAVYAAQAVIDELDKEDE
jgi:hypothetical protein